MSEPTPPIEPQPAPPPRRRSAWPALIALSIVVLALAALAAHGWQQGWLDRLRPQSAAATAAPATPPPADPRIEALEQEGERLRQEQRALDQRLRDTSASLRVVRDEALALAQRAELLEESLARLADVRQRGATALRLDEVELLLSLGGHRLELAGDADAARSAYLAAQGVLARIEDPGYTNLRQSLAQELAALRALPEDPRDVAYGELAALQAALAGLPPAGTAVPDEDAAPQGPVDRLLGRLVRVRRVDDAVPVTAADRAALAHALDVELTLARAALERREEAAFGAALERIDAALAALYAPTPALDERRRRLQALVGRPLRTEMPLLGSTLAQLRGQRAAGSVPAPAPEPLPAAQAPSDDADTP
ncbi:uroporphyrinogen-III C-methyltransferase [Coralloluteibacterium thermophilus]|uniref:Uroporphyrinogen-III C-methyltransferase n=1 Tax=Coralloluteibacterium thermophilum TaxID=2707049 RepID=A0ABV9NIP7_9GAMM